MCSNSLNSFEKHFSETVRELIPLLEGFAHIDTVVGIPFFNEKTSLLEMLQLLCSNPENLPSPNTMIACIGDPAGSDILEAIKRLNLPIPHFEYVLAPGINGRGASIRALIEIANYLEADLIVLAADLKQEHGRGFRPDWVKRLALPIQKDYDLALGCFQRHQLEDPVGVLFTGPLLEVFYGFRVTDPTSGIYAVSHDLLENYCQDIRLWTDTTRGYGIDPWLITRALRWNKAVCEVKLESKLARPSREKVDLVCKDNALSLFECITRDDKHWSNRPQILKHLDVFGRPFVSDVPMNPAFSFIDLVGSFKSGCSQYGNLLDSLLPSDIAEHLKDEVQFYTSRFSFGPHLWAAVVNNYLLAYAFKKEIPVDDLLISLTSLFNGRMAGFLAETTAGTFTAPDKLPIEQYSFPPGAVEAARELQRQAFYMLSEGLSEDWRQAALDTRPVIVPAHYMEFIPGVPVILPKTIVGPGNATVRIEEVFTRLQNRYQDRFNKFVHEGLNLPGDAASRALVAGVAGVMAALENILEAILPGDLYTEEGIDQLLKGIFDLFSFPRVLAVKSDVLREMLIKFRASNLIISRGYHDVQKLVADMDVRDAVSLAGLMENQLFIEQTQEWLLENLSPEDMEEVDLKPLILGNQDMHGSYRLLTTSNFNILVARILASPLSKGVGGRYPRLRYCLSVVRQAAISVNYSRLWRIYVRERRNLGDKIGNSLAGWYRTGTFSVNNIMESTSHRLLVGFFEALVARLKASGRMSAAKMLELMVQSYGLSQTLADGTFLPCSAWTWASYSYKGGQGLPTPLSSHVEERWFNHDLLEEIFSSLGYDTAVVDEQAIQLVGEGRSNEDLLTAVLGATAENVVAVSQDTYPFPPTKSLVRYPGNPILSPIKEHFWESRYVLNAASLRIKDRVYILYRAYGDDEISRIGLAITDGYRVLERLPYPVYTPLGPKEKTGVEAPRVVVIDGYIYMMYTAYDGVIAQVSAAAISLDDFLNRRFDRWERKGLAFEDVWDKDAILFPEKIKGRYVIYHRIEPGIWVSYLDELKFPAPRGRHSIIMGPRSGRMWDSVKIGAGTQPLKTDFGWLMIYHGVDRDRVYRLGVMLVDARDPERLLYRSPNPVLSPETECEIGIPGKAWVCNVVFTCGAVPAEDKDLLYEDDELLVYYGAADSHLCMATCRVGDLLPEEIRRKYRGAVYESE